jgi:mono/diheme cytochrome c family protein
MNTKLSRMMAFWVGPVALGAIVALAASHSMSDSIAEQTRRQAELVPPVRFTAVNIDLPVSASAFPPAPGSEIAASNCVMCHSAGMVLRQPPLTVDEWHTEITKMRNLFGAPIPAEQVDALARYLGVVNGRKSGPSTVDSQGS